MRQLQFGLLGAFLSIVVHPVDAQRAQFRHVVLIVQENRTPDNIFGSNPTFEKGVDIATSGVNSYGKVIALTAEPLASCYDIDHSHEGFEDTLNYGANRDMIINNNPDCIVPANPQYKFADNSTGTVQPYFDIAAYYGFANRVFQTNEGPSFPAHQFLFGGTSQPTTDSALFADGNPTNQNEDNGCAAPADQRVTLIDGNGKSNTNAPIFPCFEHPTLSDLLDNAAISWHYYAPSPNGLWNAPNAVAHVCGVTAVNGKAECDGPDWANGDVQPYSPSNVLVDTQNCALATISWVIPTAENSDHATVTDGNGPNWVASVVNAIGEQPTCPSGENYWKDTAILITWDDWGGWYDHVAPFAVNLDSGSHVKWGDGYTYGFRVPLMVVSAFTPPGFVDNKTHDFGSMLYFVERNFGLGFIGPNNSLYSNYADEQAASRGDSLADFFSLKAPRPFEPIPSAVAASFFVHEPLSGKPVDTQ